MQPSPDSRAYRTARWIGLVAFFWFFLTGFWGPDGHRLASVILLGWLICWAAVHARPLVSCSLVWLAVASSAYIAIRSGLGYWSEPASLEWQIKHGTGLVGATGIGAMLLVPWLVDPLRCRRMYAAFGVAFASLVVQAVLHFFVHPEDGIRPLAGNLGLQMGPNSLGPICGVFLVGTIVVISYVLKRTAGTGIRLQPLLAMVLLLGAGGLTFVALILTQSRAGWLGTAVVVPIVLVIVLGPLIRAGSTAVRRATVVFLALFLAVGAFLSHANWSTLENNVLQERDQIARVAQLDFSNPETGSVGNRIRMWQVGLAAVGERPVLGWSPGGTKRLIAERTPFDYEHVHSTPLQIAVSLGLPGLVLILALVAVGIREVCLGLSSGVVPFELGVFWLGSMGLMLISTTFDFQLHDDEFQFVAVALAAVPFAAQVDRKIRARSASRSAASAVPPSGTARFRDA